MLRLIIFLCILQYSIGLNIRGRVLLDDDENKNVKIPIGSILTVSFQDTSIPDIPGKIIKEVQISNLTGFPINYEMEIVNSPPPMFIYSITARITNGKTLLFINNIRTNVPIKSPSPITVDISVINVNQGVPTTPSQVPFKDIQQYSWPEMLGKYGAVAVNYIKMKTGFTKVFTVLEGSLLTMDMQSDRVRVVVNENGIVTQVPYIG
ncbi:unnamed protein product [Rotaria sp. Silwood1]|nr:unnamed protein product [Rotaria sp. Silwood1]CAF3409527.1 unnamed protein product [Rotaria sp. Silwood1]CAF3415168.1 unnamed protein product [Rotaria sp. Silwood1]CAF4801211.1 unnamed protein product [Rotaria sp. Silwood1]CAF5139337.1 unnamed protein product [Rotaria sp. Silwood1]